MYWIALLPGSEERSAWSWRALQFTPRVALLDEAVLLEASASLRLWGGRQGLLKSLLRTTALAPVQWAEGRTALAALGLARLRQQEDRRDRRSLDELPLQVLSAAREHVATLERIGCRSWGDLRRLPRAGLARRFGAALLEVLDCAYGERPERHAWLQLPEVFDLKFELPALATSAGELMWAAQRLLSQLQIWLQARHLGVLAIELEWTLDLRRLNGVRLPSHEQLAVRTAQPTQDVTHLRRLVGEQLARTELSAPANHLRLRSLETVPWQGPSISLLPEDQVTGEALHQFIERLSVRLGAENVLLPRLHADHRPERMQSWVPARTCGGSAVVRTSKDQLPGDALYPAWLLPQPQRLEVRGDKPHYRGPLRLLAGPQRLETGWWDPGLPGPAMRDYFIAASEQAGLLWIYRERLVRGDRAEDFAPVRWYLHGVYA